MAEYSTGVDMPLDLFNLHDTCNINVITQSPINSLLADMITLCVCAFPDLVGLVSISVDLSPLLIPTALCFL